MTSINALWSLIHDNGIVISRYLTFIVSMTILGLGFCAAAEADVWRWVDANGNSRFVDSITPIYTWLDEQGKAHFSDTPDHYSAVKVELVWHSNSAAPNKLALGTNSPVGVRLPPDESDDERLEREQAEAYYCNRARGIYDSYLNAPRLYDTDSDGNRVYLSDSDGETLLADTRRKVDALCN